RNQLSPNERLERLLDPGMPFLRLHSVANYLVEDENPETSVAGASMIVGIGFVKGVRCVVWSDDSGIKAGAMTVSTAPVSLSIQEMAMRQKLPLVHLVESAGANLVDFLVESWIGAGEVFRNLATMSAMGLPTVSVLHGPSTAGGAYMPGMSDYVVGIKNNGLAALAGAALVKAATGEEVEERELGGTEMHASVSGVVEYLAEDDAHGIEVARDLMQHLDWNKNTNLPPRNSFDEPVHSPDELAGVVPVQYKTPYDMREILLRICDGSDFMEFKPGFGVTTVCAQASIMGIRCGIIGNNGPIDPQGANKVGQFIQLCDQSDTPLIFLSNTTGFIVGTDSEQAGMIKHGAKMIQAVTNAHVPKITLYIGASFGAGNYAMCGYSYRPDFLFSWPNARTNVMGGEQAAGTMKTVAEAGAKKRGIEVDQEKLAQQSATIEAHFTKQESAFYCSGRVLDHGIIDPRDTRNVLGFALETCLEGRHRTLRPNSFGVARL
ncbi:MAG: acyl-CoA carboxylase subunit beta, partial [Alphaproteobacteria bacterium]